MKEKRDSAKKDRTYDSEGYTRRAGCLCFKTDSEKEVLLVTSKGSPDKWIVPAGGVENGEQYDEAAVREALEEDDISRKRTMLYVLIVKEELEVWQDAAQGGRRRAWFSVHKAWDLLSHRPCQQSYLSKVIHSHSNSEPVKWSSWTLTKRPSHCPTV
ncbi:diphosphoinositol polyphosphate phosphohydrolase 1-like isoform X4 [Montipora capricornis]|uniref:diphosphoinositol polyphosphate phosphohydrolase 1-like isoform X4 n=1 Tax=Montipora capricornis TaxID=246305 RepID=UPI0035F107EE